MSDLDPKHVEAVVWAWGNQFPAGSLGDLFAQDRARNFLTSTDPDVHAALLAALVRAGVLEETLPSDRRSGGRRRRYRGAWEDET